MTEWNEKAQALTTLIRLSTFPLAIRMVESADAFPEKTRRPYKDLGFKTNVCAGMTLARKYGWTVGITAEDNICPAASYTYGWSSSEPDSEKNFADFMEAMGYAADRNAAISIVASAKQFKLAKGQYAGIVFSPLEKSRIEPQLVMIFCNAAQLMRLVHGATHQTSISLKSVFSGKFGSCTEGVLQVLKTKESKVVLPGNGDRVWAMVQDDELALVTPVECLDSLIQGLEATHRNGVRYPIPVDIRHEPLWLPQAKTTWGKA
jgi:uncharacterized protein (DUF169 family)